VDEKLPQGYLTFCQTLRKEVCKNRCISNMKKKHRNNLWAAVSFLAVAVVVWSQVAGKTLEVPEKVGKKKKKKKDKKKLKWKSEPFKSGYPVPKTNGEAGATKEKPTRPEDDSDDD
jgi:hypothetical protein